MSSIKDKIDNYIKTGAFEAKPGSNLYGRIQDRIKLYMGYKDKDALRPDNFKGIDKLIAERVNTLYKPTANVSNSVASEEEEAKKKKVLPEYIDDVVSRSGYIVWAGNEAYLSPWLKEFIPDSKGGTDSSETTFNYAQTFLYSSLCTDVTINDPNDTTILDLARPMFITKNRLIRLSKSTKKLILTTVADKSSLNYDGGTNSNALLEIDLSHVINLGGYEDWSYGKILYSNDKAYISIVRYKTAAIKNLFERPSYYYGSSATAEGYTVNTQLIMVNLLDSKCTAYEAESPQQSKIKAIVGYSDIILHNDKVFAIRSKNSTTSTTFKGFRLGSQEDTKELIKVSPPISHTFQSYSFEIVELADSGPVVVSQITTPTCETERFGFTGSRTMYTSAKFAASDLNPNTFYVQLYYTLVMQLPYSYSRGFTSALYAETGFGKTCRKNPEFYATILDGSAADGYTDSALVSTINGARLGGICFIAGHLYLEVQTTEASGSYTSHCCDIIYETVAEAQPVYSPKTSSLKFWSDAPKPEELYSNNWSTSFASPLDLFITYHAVLVAIGEPEPYSRAIVNATGAYVNTAIHPIALDIKARIDRGDTVSKEAKSICYWPTKDPESKHAIKWIYQLETGLGDFPFPYEKWFSNFVGNRSSNSWGVGGFDAWADSFLVTYQGEKYPAGGTRSSDSARPVLIIGGIGPYAEKWGATGWGGQMTQSPLVVEVYAYENVNNIVVSGKEAVFSSSMPRVYMQGNETIFGAIGNYYTGFDKSSPTTVLEHGMHPIPQNGYFIDEDQNIHTVNTTCYADMRISNKDPRDIYYVLFQYKQEVKIDKITGKRTPIYDNYMIETRAYRVTTDKNENKMQFWAGKTNSFWWCPTAPAAAGSKKPWWGPAQIDMHVRI